jgi:hypothetical protein
MNRVSKPEGGTSAFRGIRPILNTPTPIISAIPSNTVIPNTILFISNFLYQESVRQAAGPNRLPAALHIWSASKEGTRILTERTQLVQAFKVVNVIGLALEG